MQGGRSIASKGGRDSEDVWGEFMEVEAEAESRKKLDERNRRKSYRSCYEMSTGCRLCQGNAGEHQGVTAARVASLMPEHQKVQESKLILEMKKLLTSPLKALKASVKPDALVVQEREVSA